MRRKEALGKLRRVYERLDGVDPKTFFVVPPRLYLFGSVLKYRPMPTDIDLLFQCEWRTYLGRVFATSN